MHLQPPVLSEDAKRLMKGLGRVMLVALTFVLLSAPSGPSPPTASTSITGGHPTERTFADSGVMFDGDLITMSGVDENTAFTYTVLGVYGPNQLFPSGPGATIPGVTDADSFWREYFRYFLHYQVTGTPRPNLLRIWVQDDNWCSCAQDLWSSNPTAFYNDFDRMTYWAHRAGVYVVPILGSNVAPAAMYDRSSSMYASRIAFDRELMAHAESDPAIAMWDLFNEPDSHFSTLAAYRSWATGLVSDLRSATTRPFTIGHIGLSRGFGFDEATYRAYNDISGLDVAHEHAYFSAEDQYLIDWRAQWARGLGKPYFIGEFGYNGNGPYGYWPWFASKWGAAGVGPSAAMVWYGAGRGPFADYPYFGPLPAYPADSSFDFTVQVTPSSSTVIAGQSVTATVSTTLTAGTSQPVDFSASGLPSGTTATFNPVTCSPPCTSTLTLSTSPTTPTGTYPLTVTAKGGGVVRTASLSLTVTATSSCPNVPTSYPTTTWDRVWCDAALINKLADTPDEPNEKFDNNWMGGIVGGIRADDVGFQSGRTLTVPTAADYQFTVGADDGIRMWIDGALVLDRWIQQPYTTYDVTALLTAGDHPMRLDYYEGQFDARVSFTYSSVATADTVPPAAVTDLAATAANTTSVVLQWTAPGDDGMIGQATWYDFRYNTSGPITDSNFDDATHYELPFFPHSPGTVERATVSGLQTGVQYWFALRTADEVPNWSEVSNSPSGVPKDTTPPATVKDLLVVSVGSSNVSVRWTAPGDDGTSGQATWYDFRYSTSGRITNTNFYAATHYELPFFPHPAGTIEQATISGLRSGTRYWFALRTADEVPNWSGVSNSPRATTKTGGTGAGGTGACDGCSSDSIWDFGYVGGIPGVLVAGLVLAVGVGGLASWRVAVRRRNHPSPRGRRAPSTR